MPFIQVKIKKGGKIEADFLGFPGDSCEQAHGEMRERLKNLRLQTLVDMPKEDRLLQEEEQHE